MRLIKLLILFIAAVINYAPVFAQKANAQVQTVARPKLVVGIVIDQMRWDYLYRYYKRYQVKGGFRRLLDNGFTCERNLIPYTPTVTACGHTSIYTGSVPAIHGVVSNGWYDAKLKRVVYCAEDGKVQTVGEKADGPMSPSNMFVTTIGDELRIATNYKAKVFGVSLKDRGAIFPAGHSANAAYWLDYKTFTWVSSTHYMKELPNWLTQYNKNSLAETFCKEGWNTLYPISTYTESTADEKSYEATPFGKEQKGFPYKLSQYIGKGYGALSTTPFGNTVTAEMAKQVIANEQLGADETTDLLTVSFSSPDHIGHTFGPNSIEVEDNYLRLDKTLGDFFDYLDTKIGKGQYTIFLSADHGVAHVAGYMKENKLPTVLVRERYWVSELNNLLKQKFNADKIVSSWNNYQIYLNHDLIDSLQLNETSIRNTVIKYLSKQDGVANVFNLNELMLQPMNAEIKQMVANGYYPARSGDIQVIPSQRWYTEGATGTSHSVWNPYDAHIPLLWYGWGIKKGKSNKKTYMTDIAPTIAALLSIQEPSGNIGNVLEEVLK